MEGDNWMINVRQKGAGGEREICDALNVIIKDAMRQLKYTEDEIRLAGNSVQRNQNQSAVGGNDLTNTFGMSIEVKRQEVVSLPAWWKQCEEDAKRNGEHPVLLWRQNGKKWNCMTKGYVHLPDDQFIGLRVTISFDDFKVWFHHWVVSRLKEGHEVRT